MKWSWKLFEFRGIGVYMHATFLILIAFVVFAHWRFGVWKTVEGVLFVLAIFACIVLHEFGHALTAARYGIRTRDITLLPIGGLARLERMPDKPLQELWVALAGPAVNIVIVGILFVGLTLANVVAPLSEFNIASGSFWANLMLVNIILVLFNALPAFPMDGGRVVRALLATRMNYVRATQIAANLGQAMALLFAVYGLLAGQPFLMLIALFVWIGAAQEASMVEIKSSLNGIPVSRAMITQFETLSADDPLSQAVDLILAGAQQDFPVMNDGQVAGVLTRHDLLVGLTEHGQRATVGDIMQKPIETIDASEPLESAFQRLQSSECPTLPVIEKGSLVGLLTMENVGEFVAIQSALVSANSSRGGAMKGHDSFI